MKTLTLLGCITCLAVALPGCGTDPIILGELLASSGDDGSDPPPSGDPPVPVVPEPSDPPEPVDPLEEVAMDILRVNCGSCHIGEEAAGDFGYVDDLDLMIETRRIVPGSKEDSPVYARMVEGSMPPAALQPYQRPTDEQIELVGYFIDQLE